TYNMWHGYTETPLHHMMSKIVPFIEVEAYGNFARLQNKTVSTELFTDITTGAAIGKVLDAAGFPASKRNIATGKVTLPFWWADEVNAFAMLEQLRQSEGVTAQLYEDGQGN